MRQAFRDQEKLDALIADLETTEKTHLVASAQVAAYAVRNNIRKAVSRLVGADAAEKHWVLHGQQNGNGNSLAPIQAHNIQVIFEPFTGGDPDFVPGHRMGHDHDVREIEE